MSDPSPTDVDAPMGHRVRERTYDGMRKVAVGLVGGTVLLIGVVLIVTPGPALLVIPAGLAILAIEFEWSRRWLRKLRAVTRKEEAENR